MSFYTDIPKNISMEALIIIGLIVLIVLTAIIQSNLSAMKHYMAYLNQNMAELRKRLDNLQQSNTPPADYRAPATNTMPAPPAYGERQQAPTPTSTPPPPIEIPASPQHNPAPRPVPRRKRNIEKLIGENLFSKLGILILVIGIGFFVKFAIDNEWLGEVGRTVLGLTVGAALCTLSFFLRRNYRTFSSILAGGGFATCFVTVAIAYNIYSLFTATWAFGILAALTTAMIAIAMCFDRRELALTAIIGGFVAPFLANSGEGSIAVLMGYVAILDAATFAITLRRNWWELPVASCVATYVITGICTLRPATHTSAEGVTLLVFTLLFFLLFSWPICSAISRWKGSGRLLMLLVITLVLNDIAYVWLSAEQTAMLSLPFRVTGIPAAIAASVSAILFWKYYRHGYSALMQNLLLGSVIVFAAIFYPLQFTGLGIILVGLTVNMAAITYLWCRKPLRVFTAGALALGALSALLILLEMGAPGSLLARNEAGGTLIACGALYAGIGALILPHITNRQRHICFLAALWGGVAVCSYGTYRLLLPVASEITALRSGMVVAFTAMIMVTLFIKTKDYLGKFLPAIGLAIFLSLCLQRSGNVAKILLWFSMAELAAIFALEYHRYIRKEHHAPSSPTPFRLYFCITASIFFIASTIVALNESDLHRFFNAGISIAMSLCGGAQMVAGMKWHSKPVRILSLCFFGVVLIKLALYDLWRLPMPGRIAVFILLGILLLSISFLYQRLHKALFGDAKENEENDSRQ